MHQLSKETPESPTQEKKKSTQKNTQIDNPIEEKPKKEIPICDSQIRRKSNYQKARRACEEKDKC